MADTDSWTEINPYALSHPDGWLISRYVVSGINTFLLWDPCGKCQGKFGRIPSAKRAFTRLASRISARLHEAPDSAELDSGMAADDKTPTAVLQAGTIRSVEPELVV
ncbi:hypothetical protein B0G84_9164 [Paraburkholderia sp. BL8N3]|nr:hypothetical protein [Paraburkholderia sp. BL8N3]TCK32032.1 hypothetical protein B0G84_9164 [Paraburkholderia sp. BL8N3]